LRRSTTPDLYTEITFDNMQVTVTRIDAVMSTGYSGTVVLHCTQKPFQHAGLPRDSRPAHRCGYVSLFGLAKQQGRHFRAVKKELDAAGVKPALNPERIGATFYRRRDCSE